MDPVRIVRPIAAELETDVVDGRGAKLDNDFQPLIEVEIRSLDKLLFHRSSGSVVGRILPKEPFAYFHANRIVKETDAKEAEGGVASAIFENSKATFEVFLKDKERPLDIVVDRCRRS
jgi:hypothetical protein